MIAIFLLMGHFLYRFCMFFCEKNEENLLSQILNFLQNAPSNSVHLTSSLSFAVVSNASLRVKVCENDGSIVVIKILLYGNNVRVQKSFIEYQTFSPSLQI